MDIFPFTEFGNMIHVNHTSNTFSGFQWATALNSEKADSVITHLLEVMAVMGIPAQIKMTILWHMSPQKWNSSSNIET